jgi:hypothetical protein
MFNKIDSNYNSDVKLIRFHNLKLFKKIILSLVVTVLINSLFFIYRGDFSWGVLIVLFIAAGFTLFPIFEKIELIDIKWDENNALIFTYYNLLDKIVTESFKKSNIKSIRVKSRQKRVVIELIDYRVIKLDYTKQQELDILNSRLDSML